MLLPIVFVGLIVLLFVCYLRFVVLVFMVCLRFVAFRFRFVLQLSGCLFFLCCLFRLVWVVLGAFWLFDVWLGFVISVRYLLFVLLFWSGCLLCWFVTYWMVNSVVLFAS